MTSYNKQQARDAIYTLIYDGIKADAYTDGFKILFEDDDSDDATGTNEPNADESWFEIILKHNRSRQSALQGSTGNRRYERNGTVVINIYTPRGNNLKINDNISEIISEIFETANISIWFRNTNSSEIGIYRSWFLTTVTSEFEYDQIR